MLRRTTTNNPWKSNNADIASSWDPPVMSHGFGRSQSVVSYSYLVGGFNMLKNMCQWEGLSHVLWEIKHV